jgi:CBS domain-containing protein
MKIREVMTSDPVTLDASAPVIEAAEAMRHSDIGDVVIRKNGKLCGIVTDRDIVVRVLAAGKDPRTTNVESICSRDMLTVSPDQDTSTAVKLMRERAIRRLPVVENSNLLGMISLGDLAVALDRRSALSDISAAPPSQ